MRSIKIGVLCNIKPKIVRAIQWMGENAEEIRNFLPTHYGFKIVSNDKYTNLLYIGNGFDDTETYCVEAGRFIVLNHSGEDISDIYSENDFYKTYDLFMPKDSSED